MADTTMNPAERAAYLAELHVGVLAVERPGRGPIAHPVWYVWDGDDVIIGVEAGALKARLLEAAGRATLTVQDEAPPYRYVSVEGPVTLTPAHDGDGYDLRSIAVRYLGEEAGAQYADATEGTYDALTVRLHPERWNTVDFTKSWG